MRLIHCLYRARNKKRNGIIVRKQTIIENILYCDSKKSINEKFKEAINIIYEYSIGFWLDLQESIEYVPRLGHDKYQPKKKEVEQFTIIEKILIIQ